MRRRYACRDSPPPVWRRPLAWLLVIAFSGHGFIYYGLTAWLPAYLIDTAGMTAIAAGVAASVFQILALVGSFGASALAVTGRMPGATLLIGNAIAWFVTPLGFLVAPGQWLLWSVVGGIASGGGFTIIFMLIMDHARDISENRKISSLVQGIGYIAASTGPFVVGSVRHASGGWATGFLLLAGVAALIAMTGVGLSRWSQPKREVWQ